MTTEELLPNLAEERRYYAAMFDRLERKIDDLQGDMAEVKIKQANITGKLTGGWTVIVFVGTIVGGVAGWITALGRAHS